MIKYINYNKNIISYLIIDIFFNYKFAYISSVSTSIVYLVLNKSILYLIYNLQSIIKTVKKKNVNITNNNIEILNNILSIII